MRLEEKVMRQLTVSDGQPCNWTELSCFLNRVETLGFRSVAGRSRVNH